MPAVCKMSFFLNKYLSAEARNPFLSRLTTWALQRMPAMSWGYICTTKIVLSLILFSALYFKMGSKNGRQFTISLSRKFLLHLSDGSKREVSRIWGQFLWGIAKYHLDCRWQSFPESSIFVTLKFKNNFWTVGDPDAVWDLARPRCARWSQVPIFKFKFISYPHDRGWFKFFRLNKNLPIMTKNIQGLGGYGCQGTGIASKPHGSWEPNFGIWSSIIY